MARILKWQEKLVLACAVLLFSVTSGLGLGPHDSASTNRPSSSHVMTLTTGKSVARIELAAQKPYVRLVRATLLPVSLPLAAGAYVAMASATGSAAPPDASATAAPDAAAATCGTGGGGCVSHCTVGTHCWTIICTEHGDGSYTCHTCDRGTCVCC